MSESHTRKITVGALTRVEGEGALHVRLRDDRVEDVLLSIYEPPRFFEAFLRGRRIEEVPDITARICGICPVAYQMTAVHALEAALGIRVPQTIRQLRRLLYCGEWIESHTLHIFLLNAPDFFGVDSGIELAERFPDEINRGLKLKRIGNRLLEVLGGRAIHPINVRVGGFYRCPAAARLTELLPDLRWARQAAIDSARWVRSFDFPDYDRPVELIALRHGQEYPMNEGEIASTHRPPIDVADYRNQFSETQVPHSTALHSEIASDQAPYLLGPLARLHLNHERLFPQAKRLAHDLFPRLPMTNRFGAILARCIEVVHAIEEAIAIIETYRPPATPFVDAAYRDGFGCAATEAPRGMIYHSYQITDQGTVAESRIVPPTSQNQKQIERDLAGYLPSLLQHDDRRIALECEKLIRTYDPCISCSTHFLKLRIDRDDRRTAT